MKKVLGFAMLSLALVFSSCTEKEIKDVLELVSNETVTVSAKGGDCIIEVNSNSALSAVSSAEWVKTEVIDNSNVKAIVGAYEGNEVRTATVTVSNAGSAAPVTVRINQAAVNFDFTPSDYEFEAGEGQYSFPYTADAALKAEVEEGVEWLEVEVTGTELVLKAKANEAIRKRAADVNWTIGTVKGSFTVSQKGAEATLESANFKDGNFDAVAASVSGANVVYEYTTNSELEVSSEQDWIETYTEDGKLYINVIANEGGAREGAVAWSVKGSETLNGSIAVSQKGIFLHLSLVPTVLSSEATSTLCNTIAVSAQGNNVTSIKMSDLYTAAEFNALDVEKQKADVKANGDEFTEAWLGYVNKNGLRLTLSITCTPATEYYLIAWATNGDDEAYYVVNASTLSENIFDDYDDNTNFYKIQNKSQLYGEYYFLAKTTDDTTQPLGDRDFMGMVTFSDGESSIEGDAEYNWVNVEGMWGSFFNSNYRLTNDIYKFDLYEGMLYSQEPETLGDLVQVSTGNAAATSFNTRVGFEGSDYIYSKMYGAIVGGVIDEDGTLAFINSGIYAEQKDNDGVALANYSYIFLYGTMNGSLGWFGAARDFMFVPSGNYSAAKVAAASRRVEAIRKEYCNMKRNYVETSDTRFERAVEKVAKDYRMAEAIAF
ncbi:MAG: BACON domain-containing protein [Bacteroidales bacterium]|nr:BACON domain-containing protein [Bacteroidales bacterium]